MKIADPGGARFPSATFPDEPADFAAAFNARRVGEPAGSSEPRKTKFQLVKIQDVSFSPDNEWRLKHIIPMQGVGVIFGRKKSFKSFVATEICFAIAAGRPFVGKRSVKGAIVYIVAEGQAGFRKRIEGARQREKFDENTEFYLIEVAPNLGAGAEDATALIEAIKRLGVAPAVVAVDTVAQSMGGADENGSGMTTFIANCQKVAQAFSCFVLLVHHVGHGDDKRLRGHSSFGGAIDMGMLVEKSDTVAGVYEATAELVDVKDEASGIRLNVILARVVIGRDKDGDESSTLVVENVERAAEEKQPPKRKLSAAEKSYLDALQQTLIDFGRDAIPLAGTPKVKVVERKKVREFFDARWMVDDKLSERQQQNNKYRSFKRAEERLTAAHVIALAKVADVDLVWLCGDIVKAGDEYVL